jgi:hypothetical protein
MTFRTRAANPRCSPGAISARPKAGAIGAAAMLIALSVAGAGCTQNAASQWAQTSPIIKSVVMDDHDQAVRLGTRGL